MNVYILLIFLAVMTADATLMTKIVDEEQHESKLLMAKIYELMKLSGVCIIVMLILICSLEGMMFLTLFKTVYVGFRLWFLYLDCQNESTCSFLTQFSCGGKKSVLVIPFSLPLSTMSLISADIMAAIGLVFDC